MIKFFRNIRLINLKEGKTASYIKYAIGEIFLVVIGILIALSINNWNENLKAKSIEQDLLKSLSVEINSNLEQLDSVIKSHTYSKNINIIILKTFGKSINRSNENILDSLVEMASVPLTLNPKLGVVKSIISTGDIKYIKNPLIVQFITSIEDNINTVQDDFNRLIGIFSQQLWPRENLYIHRLNRANLNKEYFGINFLKSNLKSDYDGFFKDIVLENTYMLTLYEQIWITEREELLLDQMKAVQKLINSEIINSN